MKIITVITICLITLTSNAQNVKLEIGKKISIYNKSDIVSQKPDAAGGGETKIQTELFSSLEIVSKSDSNYKAVYTVNRMTNKNEDAGDLDSDNAKDRKTERGEMIFKGLSEAKEKYIDFNSGKITDLAIKNTTVVKANDGPEGKIKIGVKEAGNITDNLFLIITADKKIGDKWTTEQNIEGIKTTKTYELKNLENGIATLSLTTLSAGTTTTETHGVSIERNETTTSVGTITVDIKTSMVKKITTKSNTEGSIEVEGNSTPISIKRETVTTFE